MRHKKLLALIFSGVMVINCAFTSEFVKAENVTAESVLYKSGEPSPITYKQEGNKYTLIGNSNSVLMYDNSLYMDAYPYGVEPGEEDKELDISFVSSDSEVYLQGGQEIAEYQQPTGKYNVNIINSKLSGVAVNAEDVVVNIINSDVKEHDIQSCLGKVVYTVSNATQPIEKFEIDKYYKLNDVTVNMNNVTAPACDIANKGILSGKYTLNVTDCEFRYIGLAFQTQGDIELNLNNSKIRKVNTVTQVESYGMDFERFTTDINDPIVDSSRINMNVTDSEITTGLYNYYGLPKDGPNYCEFSGKSILKVDNSTVGELFAQLGIDAINCSPIHAYDADNEVTVTNSSIKYLVGNKVHIEDSQLEESYGIETELAGEIFVVGQSGRLMAGSFIFGKDKATAPIVHSYDIRVLKAQEVNSPCRLSGYLNWQPVMFERTADGVKGSYNKGADFMISENVILEDDFKLDTTPVYRQFATDDSYKYIAVPSDEKYRGTIYVRFADSDEPSYVAQYEDRFVSDYYKGFERGYNYYLLKDFNITNDEVRFSWASDFSSCNAYYKDVAYPCEVTATNYGATTMYEARVEIKECVLYDTQWKFDETQKQDSVITLKDKTVVYNGKAVAIDKATVTGSAGAVTYQYYSDKACTKSVAASNVKNSGTYYVKATVAEDSYYNGATSNVATLTIQKAAQKITVKKSTITSVKLSALKAKKRTVSSGISVLGKAKVTYAKASGTTSGITINKTNGKITIAKVAKKTKKKTYTVKIKVKVSATNNYKALTQTKTIKIKVK